MYRDFWRISPKATAEQEQPPITTAIDFAGVRHHEAKLVAASY
jgi:hypothetical protein